MLPMRRTKLDTKPATPTEITADHGHISFRGQLTDPVKYELPVRWTSLRDRKSAVIIWSYDNGDCGIALHPWRPRT